MAEGGRGRGRRRGHHRRDRNRQGDHGGRGGRGRHAWQDPGRRGHRGSPGQRADRAAAGGWRGRKRPGRRDARRSGSSGSGGRTGPAGYGSPAGARRAGPIRGAGRRAGLDRGDGDAQRARGLARRHGRGNAPGSGRLPHGRGGRRVPGRLQGEPGPARRVRRQAGHRHADHGARLRRDRRGRGLLRPQAHCRVHDLQLRHAGDRPHHQLGRQDPLHVRRPGEFAHRLPRPQRRGGARGGAALPVLRQLVRPYSGPEGDRALVGGRRQGLAEIRDPRSQSGDLPGERGALRSELRGAGHRGLDGPHR